MEKHGSSTGNELGELDEEHFTNIIKKKKRIKKKKKEIRSC